MRDNVPAGNDFDERLQQLALEAKQHPPLSPQRQLALNKLVNQILQADSLSHPQSGLWLPHLYEDFYNEALQKTLLEICQKIDRYNPGYAVMAWVNYLLAKRFQDVIKAWYSNNGRREQIVISLNELDQLISKELPPAEKIVSESEMLRQFLEADPENLLKTEFIRGYPQANFQCIAIARFVEEKTWEDISLELNNLSVQTLCSFFHRRLHKLMPYFQKYLQ
ncbi:MAG: hypothetical protein KME19_20955 [Microcoleus vaginatus WJT46-NPBG5]|jgi:hypothetical protein|nr:hypothetical protein [Microcoleus vaginatus WJT46-NPBG5]